VKTTFRLSQDRLASFGLTDFFMIKRYDEGILLVLADEVTMPL